ncbi:MAG: UDP-N-acetylmuramate dehydrogenase [bacterium]|nr:UDP-N-acetylmuramate dehydrogenase [bacterium]
MKPPIDLGIREQVSLAALNAYRIGGPARYYVRPDQVDQLRGALGWAKEAAIPIFILGAGTNLLISNNGFDGLIVHLQGFSGQIKEPVASGEWSVGAGAMLLGWVKKAAHSGFAGTEALAGIPGTIGGALRMNAGAFGQEISQHLEEVEVITPELKVKRLKTADIGFAYRRAVGLEDSVILGARFQLEPGDPGQLTAHLREIVAMRRNRQPLQFPSCGSVFKRPEGDFAGRLIEAVGLKGYMMGGAQIAEKHANFIINRGGASAAEVLGLIKLVKTRVKESFGVTLEREVIMIGFSEDELAGA